MRGRLACMPDCSIGVAYQSLPPSMMSNEEAESCSRSSNTEGGGGWTIQRVFSGRPRAGAHDPLL